jgi:D-alanine-D-alanine ligase
MKNVLILCGGRSAEHEISLISAKGILDALDRTQYQPCLVGIAKDGTWYWQDEKDYYQGEFIADKIRLNENRPTVTLAPYLTKGREGVLEVSGGKRVEFDVVFPILHGQYGEDGTLQGMLDMIGIPYVGSRCGASWVCMDKWLTKTLCEKNGIPVADYVGLRRGESVDARLSEIEKMGYPVFVKPSCQGSSIGITKVKTRAELKPAVENALKYDRICLVERAIVGRELECAVMGLHDNPKSSLPGEILVSAKAEWYSYEAKYLGGELARTETPAKLDAPLTLKVQRFAENVFKVLECDGMARVDLLLETATGKLYLNEPNTLPGFTPISMYPKMWEASGLPYPQLISRLIDLAFEREERALLK